jgi:hypothetical protein
MKPRLPSGPAPKPLDAAELARVHAWQRRMYLFYGVAMILIFAGFYVTTRFQEVTWVRPLLATMILVLMGVGALVQFRERCPRCDFPLGRQSRLVLAAKCKSCGVGFVSAAAGTPDVPSRDLGA